MSPALQTLVNSANSWFGHTLDRRNLAYAYLVANATGSMTLTAPALKALVQDFPGFNDEMFLNVQIYQLAKNAGLSTDAQTLLPIIRSAISGDAGLTDAQDVLNVIKYARLRQLGAI